MARRCFQQPIKFAQALEIDEKLVCDIATIIATFKCKMPLKLDVLEKFCWETYCYYFEKYPWTQMCSSMHKLLKHGCEIARQLPLPVSYFAEDANESWHKLYRQNMTRHARQDSREHRLLDVFHRAVYMSDSLLSIINLEERIKPSDTLHSNTGVKLFIDYDRI